MTEIKPHRSRFWAHMRLEEEYQEPVMHQNLHTGEVYDTGDRGPWLWRLRCDCGAEVIVQRDLFPGRRKMQYCLRPECPYAPKVKARRAPAQQSSNFSVYLNRENVSWLIGKAKARDMSFSRALDELIDIARADALLEDDE